MARVAAETPTVEVMALPFLPAAKFVVLLRLGAEASLTLNVHKQGQTNKNQNQLASVQLYNL